MKTHSAQNERIKRAYFAYLAEAKGFSEPTLTFSLAALPTERAVPSISITSQRLRCLHGLARCTEGP